MARLTTTSYLVLGLLSTRDWSAYEIAEQLDKGVTEVWPRASRQLYNAPKQLVDESLVRARVQRTGQRTRTVYSITAAGRRALRTWLAADSAPPALEFEALVRLLFADQGTLDDLTHTLRGVRDQAEGQLERFTGHAQFIETTGGTFPDREHLFRLSTAFMLGHFAHLAQWANWALDEIENWADVTSSPNRPERRVEPLREPAAPSVPSRAPGNPVRTTRVRKSPHPGHTG